MILLFFLLKMTFEPLIMCSNWPVKAALSVRVTCPGSPVSLEPCIAPFCIISCAIGLIHFIFGYDTLRYGSTINLGSRAFFTKLSIFEFLNYFFRDYFKANFSWYSLEVFKIFFSSRTNKFNFKDSYFFIFGLRRILS